MARSPISSNARAEALDEILALGDEPRAAGGDHRFARCASGDRRPRAETARGSPARRPRRARRASAHRRGRSPDRPSAYAPAMSSSNGTTLALRCSRACTPRARARDASRRTGGALRPAGARRARRSTSGSAALSALRALAAAEHEQRERAFATRVALGWRRQRGDRRAHRIADPLALRRTRRRNRSGCAVAKRASSLFVTPGMRFCSCTTSGTPREPRRDAARRGRIAAHRQHAARRVALEHRARRDDRARESERRGELARRDPCRARREIGSVSSRDARTAARAVAPARRCRRARPPAVLRWRSSSATARPGKICPPVPPAMISTGAACDRRDRAHRCASARHALRHASGSARAFGARDFVADANEQRRSRRRSSSRSIRPS